MSAVVVFVLFDASVLAVCWTLLRLCECHETPIVVDEYDKEMSDV